MGTAPSGYQNPKTNWQASDIPLSDDFNRIESNINAIETGSRTIDPAQAPSGLTGTLRQFLDWLANRIKAITGKLNWYDAPDITLAQTAAKFDAASGHVHSGTAGDAPPVPWTNVSGKPSAYPPSAHSHLRADITDFTHTHSPSQISPQGAGSGLNADLLDGVHAVSFMNRAPTGSGSFSGPTSGTTITHNLGRIPVVVLVWQSGYDNLPFLYALNTTSFTVKTASIESQMSSSTIYYYYW